MTIAEIFKKIREKYPNMDTLEFMADDERKCNYVFITEFKNGKVYETLCVDELRLAGDNYTADLMDEILEKITIDQPSIVINGELSEAQRGKLGFFS